MPNLVLKNITAGDVRKGDLLVVDDHPTWGRPVWIDGEEHNVATVNGVEPKVTYTRITLNDGGETIRLHLVTPVIVARSEYTEEEKATQRREIALDHLREVLRKLLSSNPVAMLEEIVAEARGRNVEYDVITWSNLPGVLKAQAKWKCWIELRKLVHMVADRTLESVDVNGPDDVKNVPDGVLFDAFAWWLYEARRTIERAPDPTSRSTSPISNLLDDLDMWATCDVIDRELRWSGAYDDLVRRGIELVEEARQRSKNK